MTNQKQSTEKNKKIDTVADVEDSVKLKRDLYERNKELEEKDELIKSLSEKLNAKEKPGPKVDNETLETLKAQVEMLSRQVITSRHDAGKLKFKEPTADDLVPEGKQVTFTARNIMYVVASYRDHRGIEVIAPHKLIVFQYAASDIRKDGNEETVKNFCQYTTNLKTEIEFLRNSPYYGITFSENTNEMMDEDVKDTTFKVRAATQLSASTPEQIFSMADQYKVPNWRSKSVDQLRMLIVSAMAQEFKKENKAQQEEIARRNMLARAVRSAE